MRLAVVHEAMRLSVDAASVSGCPGVRCRVAVRRAAARESARGAGATHLLDSGAILNNEIRWRIWRYFF